MESAVQRSRIFDQGFGRVVEPVIGVVEWAKDYVGSALEPSPPASIAWAGVCLLLPVGSTSSLISIMPF